ncbi:heavy-metal-associated domain-containing protein [Isobaculum melis]|nr:cation transporter [Isobaculum melis]
MEKTMVKVTGMSCEHCVKRVTDALEGTAGVAKAKVNLKKEQAKIKFEPAEVTVEQLVAVIKETGYEAQPE